MAQVRANSPTSALSVWTRKLPSEGIPGIGHATAATLAEDLRDRAPVPLQGLVNAWCSGARARGAYALINIILTDEDQKKTRAR